MSVRAAGYIKQHSCNLLCGKKLTIYKCFMKICCYKQSINVGFLSSYVAALSPLSQTNRRKDQILFFIF